MLGQVQQAVAGTFLRIYARARSSVISFCSGHLKPCRSSRCHTRAHSCTHTHMQPASMWI
jgi:hypothetical protein